MIVIYKTSNEAKQEREEIKKRKRQEKELQRKLKYCPECGKRRIKKITTKTYTFGGVLISYKSLCRCGCEWGRGDMFGNK